MIWAKGKESLEKHLTYAEVTKSPPKPTIPTNINTNTNTNNNTNTDTNKSEPKNDNLTPEEIMKRSKNIIGIFPIEIEDIERNKSDTKEETLIKTAIEFLKDELGFRKEQVEEMNITKVAKTKRLIVKHYI